jgi:tagaturonate reductase
MQLSKATIKQIKAQPGLSVPDEKIFDLPEKVLQFGTGVLLRGLPDFFIDKANRQGIFNGRIVVVKSTAAGRTDAFQQQDGLYTLCSRGVENAVESEEMIINSSISRVISAIDNWNTVLECAGNPSLQLIISNTTEVGITLVHDDIRLYPPLSYPGKLLAFLYERFKSFNGSRESGLVIIPTELITNNGDLLRSILIELAGMNGLSSIFIEWLKECNHFCNSLVDRIVPGQLTEMDAFHTQQKLGYSDDLMILSEAFRLWAIETSSPAVKEILSFSRADEGVVLAADIDKYRELKLRLLNGSHTFSCGLAVLAGFNTVREAMTNEQFLSMVDRLMIDEISPAISCDKIKFEEATQFAKTTLDRFRNPFLDHQWKSICVQYSSKMKMRNIPLFLKHYEKFDNVPELMSLGFAAFILFMKPKTGSIKGHQSAYAGKEYTLQDDNAERFAELWQQYGTERICEAVLSDKILWGEDLSLLPGLVKEVDASLQQLTRDGALAVINQKQMNKAAF